MHLTRKLALAIAVSLACTLPTVSPAADKHKKEIEVESFSWGTTSSGKAGGQKQLKTNNSAQPKPSGKPMPSESFSLNYGKVKSGAPQGTVAQPPASAAGGDGTVDAADYQVWRKNSSAPATGPNSIGTPQQPPQPAGMLLPAVQKVRDAAATPNAGNTTPTENMQMNYSDPKMEYQKQQPGRKMGTAVKKYDVQEQKKK